MEDHQDLLDKFNQLHLQLDMTSIPSTAECTPANTDSEMSIDERKIQEIKVVSHEEMMNLSKNGKSSKALSESISGRFWGINFQSEVLLSVDYVTWFNSWIVEDENNDMEVEDRLRCPSVSYASKRISVRHALLLTNFALYLLEVKLETDISVLPNRQNSLESAENYRKSPKRRHRKMRSRSFPLFNESKICDVQVVCRLDPKSIQEISLPYNTVKMSNGEEFAQRSADLVFASKTGGHYWLQFQSNQVRGKVVDVLHEWFESLSEGNELIMSQVMSAELLRIVAEESNQLESISPNSSNPKNVNPLKKKRNPEKCILM
jgi:hypothetical protein